MTVTTKQRRKTKPKNQKILKYYLNNYNEKTIHNLRIQQQHTIIHLHYSIGKILLQHENTMILNI